MKMSKGESTYAGHNRELTVTDCFSMNYSEFHFRIKSSLKLSKFIFICVFSVTFKKKGIFSKFILMLVEKHEPGFLLLFRVADAGLCVSGNGFLHRIPNSLHC